MDDVQDRRRAGRQVLLASLWLTLLILAVKVWICSATQSLSLAATALNTLLAGFNILLSIIALTSPQVGGRQVAGHSKLEAVMALLLVAFLGFTCLSLTTIALQQLQAVAADPQVLLPVRVSLPLLQLLGLVMAANFCLAWFERYQAKILDHLSLRFTASYLFRDAGMTAIVWLGLLGFWKGYAWLDGLLALGMALLAIAGCWQVLNWQLPSLLRQIAIAPEALAQTVHQVEGITHCYAIQSRGIVGRLVFVEMHLILHPECISIARSIAERVERAIRERYGPAKVVIYIDDQADRPG